MKVRKTTWLVSFFLFALSLFILSQWAKETNSHSRFIHQNESHAEVFSVKKKDSILKNSITPLSSQANHKDFKSILVKKIQKRTSFQNQYQQAIHKLSQSIEEAGLDPNELNERYLNSLSKTAFLRQLPNEVAESYRKLFRKAHQLQQAILAEDGKPGNYFEEKQTKTQAPHWVQQRASQLKHMNLSGQLKDFVEQVRDATEVKDKDISRLLILCHQQRDCVEKSVKTWIDANHLLTKEQFELISKSL